MEATPDLVELSRCITENVAEEVHAEVKKVNELWLQKFSFTEFTYDRKKTVWESLIKRLNSQENLLPSCCLSCLILAKILSRDKIFDNAADFPGYDLINTLIRYAGYNEDFSFNFDDSDKNDHTIKYKIFEEAQKALCNFVFQSLKARKLCCEYDCLTRVYARLVRLSENFDSPISVEVTFYDLRLMFLLTALCEETRAPCRRDPTDVRMPLCSLLRKCAGKDSGPLDGRRFDIACEILKVLFNITLSCKMAAFEKNDAERFADMTMLLRTLLFVQAANTAKTEELKSNVVNLLTAIPSQFYDIVAPIIDDGNLKADSDKTESFSICRDFAAIDVLLDFLELRLNSTVQDQREALSPILTLLTEMARSNKFYRKYIRKLVLPPLRDVIHRPEEGTSLRNKIVKLMTAVSDVNINSAEFLFQLCNCNVDRMIKYTGFGNAAGMLARRGLLAGGGCNDGSRDDDETDEEVSDTDEYLRNKHKINPVLGCVEVSRPSLIANMSEEQKEQEAMRLVDEINQLMNRGVFRPGVVGKDGNVHPVEHILQLRAEATAASSQQSKSKEKEHDDEISD